MIVSSYCGYSINGYYFYTKAYNDKCMSNGVNLVTQSMHISSVKDKTPVFVSMLYYGVIQDIWVLDDTIFRVSVF